MKFDTFSGRVSTSKRSRPKQSRRTITNDEQRTVLGLV